MGGRGDEHTYRHSCASICFHIHGTKTPCSLSGPTTVQTSAEGQLSIAQGLPQQPDPGISGCCLAFQRQVTKHAYGHNSSCPSVSQPLCRCFITTCCRQGCKISHQCGLGRLPEGCAAVESFSHCFITHMDKDVCSSACSKW